MEGRRPSPKGDGLHWPGIVVSVFTTLSGKARVVVECTDPEMAGALHIYSPEQLIAAERDASRCPAPGESRLDGDSQMIRGSTFQNRPDEELRDTRSYLPVPGWSHLHCRG